VFYKQHLHNLKIILNQQGYDKLDLQIRRGKEEISEHAGLLCARESDH
jgi:hypothetical protein